MDKETETTINRLLADNKAAHDLNDYLTKENKRLREALKKVDTLQMALLLIAEDGLHDPTVKNFIISALKGNE